MPHDPPPPPDSPAALGEAAWSDVLQAMDRTYAELVDYQERLEAQNIELQSLRRFLASVMGSVSDLLVVAGKDGALVDASASFRTAAGLTQADLPGRNLLDFVAPASRAPLLAAMSGAAADKAEHSVEVDLITPQGPEPLDLRLSPQLDRRRRCTGLVLTGRPLGALRQAYSELHQSHEELKQAQTLLVRNEKLASLGRLLAGVAHELNNPISFVYANAHALEKYVDRFETYFEQVEAGAPREALIALREQLKLTRTLRNLRGALDGARDGAQRVRDIVEDLRRLSADGSGEMVAFDLVDTAQVAAQWVMRGARFPVALGVESDGPILARGRPGHIQQVLMNLIQNAVDAMEGQKNPTLRVHLYAKDGQALADIIDNGPGVSPEAAQTIFDPFFTTKDVGAGTGLGLSISHKIAEEHGGRLDLAPHDGPGACFRLTLPTGAPE